LIYAKGGTIFAQSFDEGRLESKGPPMTLADGAWSGPSVARTGIVVFRMRGYPLTQLTWRTRDGSVLGVVGTPDTFTTVELSPTGNRAAVVRSGPAMYDADLWLADLTSGVLSNLTDYPGHESDPQWGPDERHLVFTSNQAHGFAPVMKDLATGKEERLFEAQGNFFLDDWTPDGRSVIVRGGGAMYALPLSGERKLQRLPEIPPGVDQSQVSPDGTWVAFNTSNHPEVYVARFPSLTDRTQISIAGGVQPRWRGDGRELYYLSQDGTMMAVEVTNDKQLPFRPARPLFKWLTTGVPIVYGSQYDVTADGKRFLVLEPKREPADVFTFLVNWSQGLKSSSTHSKARP
jgi:eukaryotic-like serine/threonine-protein kinase